MAKMVQNLCHIILSPDHDPNRMDAKIMQSIHRSLHKEVNQIVIKDINKYPGHIHICLLTSNSLRRSCNCVNTFAKDGLPTKSGKCQKCRYGHNNESQYHKNHGKFPWQWINSIICCQTIQIESSTIEFIFH